MQIKYASKNFKAERLQLIENANVICEGYAARGLSVTLRQLYYRFVARNLLANEDRNYNRLGEAISEARLAGMFDWDYIIDRTRNVQKRPDWNSPEDLIDQAAEQYLTDLWAPQKKRIEVWIEKDAAIGVIEAVSRSNHVPYFSCRGYVSQSEMWSAGTRIGEYLRNGEQVRILHIGDHDPSGLDMTRDITDRLRTFIQQDWVNEFGWGLTAPSERNRGVLRANMRDHMREMGCQITDDELPWEVRRIALTYDQILEYAPPPNPAKTTDARFERYFDETGLDESWELDALDPIVMEELIQDAIDEFKDQDAYDAAEAKQERERTVLKAVKDNWPAIKAAHEPKTGKTP